MLFIVYIIPVGSVISKFPVRHNLCADGIWHFIFLSSCEFIPNISVLEKTFAEVCLWMSANLLLLNPSKIDFLLMGLPKQLFKVKNLSLSLPLSLHPDVVSSPVAYACNCEVFSLALNFNCLIAYPPSPNLTFSCKISQVIRPIVNQTTARIVATALIDCELDYCNSIFPVPANQLDHLRLVLILCAVVVICTSEFHHLNSCSQMSAPARNN